MTKTEYYTVIQKDLNLLQKYNQFMQEQLDDEQKGAYQAHRDAFEAFVNKSIADFLEENKEVEHTQEELFAHLAQDENLQKRFKEFVSNHFTEDERKAFQQHAIEMNKIVLDLVGKFAAAQGVEIEG